MSGGRRAAGWFPGDTPERRKYQGYPESARRELFGKDRRAARLASRVFGAESLLEFVSAVVHGRVGGRDPEWIIATIAEAVDRYDVSDKRRFRHDDGADLTAVLANLVTVDEIADRRGVGVGWVRLLHGAHDGFPAPALGADRYWWPDVLAWMMGAGEVGSGA